MFWMAPGRAVVKRSIVFVQLLLILLPGVAGIFLLSRGFGMPIPYIEYGATETWNMAVGAVLLAVSLTTAFFWLAGRVSRKRRQSRPRHPDITAPRGLKG